MEAPASPVFLVETLSYSMNRSRKLAGAVSFPGCGGRTGCAQDCVSVNLEALCQLYLPPFYKDGALAACLLGFDGIVTRRERDLVR